MNNFHNTLRRSKIVSSRALKSMPFASQLTQKIAFMHLPKCAGTSLSNALYGLVPFHHRIGVIDANATRLAAGIMAHNVVDRLSCHEDRKDPAPNFALREGQLLTHMCWKTQLIHGHFLWSKYAFEHFHNEYAFVTLMRNPVERAISNFKMNLANGIFDHHISVDDWLKSKLGFHHGSTFLRYFSGQAQISEDEAPMFLETAKANASQFTLIGCLEKKDDFVENFKMHFGVKLNIGSYNTTTKEALTLTPYQHNTLEELCRFDLEIYEHFKSWYPNHE